MKYILKRVFVIVVDFILGLLCLKVIVSKSQQDDSIQFIHDGISEFLYKQLYVENQQKSETFSRVYNKLFYDGLYQLSTAEPNEKSLLHKHDTLMHLTSMLGFHAMFKLVNRGETFMHLQLVVLESQFQLGQKMMSNKTNPTKVKIYFDRLSNLTMNYSNSTNIDVLKLQKKVRRGSFYYDPSFCVSFQIFFDTL